MSKEPNIFVTSFFQEIEDRERKSMENATRRKIGHTMRPRNLDRVVGPIFGLVDPVVVIFAFTKSS
jgi:hypothetical protein